MRVFSSVEEVVAAAGNDLGTSGWHLLDQARIDAFAAATGDHQWIHVDPERAAAGPFGTTIAHGYLTLSLLPALAAEVFSYATPGARINYGLDKVRFPQPVRAGASVRAHVHLAAVTEVPGGVRTTTRYTVEIDGEAKPACVAEALTLVLA